MKKFFLIIPAVISLSSCAHLSAEKSKTDLHITSVSPHIQDINFNEEGQLPEGIKNQSYYKIKASGSAIKNCEVIDYGTVDIKHSGKSNIFIGDARDWDIVRIDCRKDHGLGKSGEKYDFKVNVYANGLTYHASTKIEHG